MVAAGCLDLDQKRHLNRSNLLQRNDSNEHDLHSSYTFETSPSNLKNEKYAKRTMIRPIGMHSPLAETV